MMKLSADGARALMLAAQGLLAGPAAPATKGDVLAAIRRMGALQIDTIHVVARSPYLVLWSRLGAYEPGWLDELLAEGALFEYWSHAACFLPIEDYGLYRRSMLEGHPRWRAWLANHPEEGDRVLRHLRERGEVRAVDFERTGGRSSGWWDWKPEKEALECLFIVGDVMIARREANFQRVYALRERVLPDWDDAGIPKVGEARRQLALKTVRALGVATAAWVPPYFNTIARRDAPSLLERLTAEGELVRVVIEGWEEPAYIHRDHRALAEVAAAGALRAVGTTLLSPFDPLVWDRARALAIFGFHYRIEAYTPAERRRYGYFTLPVLHAGALIGRLDAKAHRRDGLFEVRALHLEPELPLTDDLVAGLAGTLRACATWHRTPEVVVRHTDPPALAGALAGAMATSVSPVAGMPGT
jgi:uncharacterized protein YcaQ